MLKVIELGKIKSTGNVRYEEDDEIDSLVESIKIHGLLEPLVVRETSTKGVYDLIAGHRRYLALIKAGEDQAECNVVKVDTPKKEVIQIVENIQRKDMSCIEIRDALDRVFVGVSDAVIAKAIGKPYQWIANVRQAARLIDKQYAEGKISKDEHTKLRAGQVLGRDRKAKQGPVKDIAGEGFVARVTGHVITIRFFNGEKEREIIDWVERNK